MTRLALVALLLTASTACNKSVGKLSIVAVCKDCELRIAYGSHDTLFHVKGNAGMSFASDTIVQYGASLTNFVGADDGYLVVQANGDDVFKEFRKQGERTKDRLWYVGTFIPE